MLCNCDKPQPVYSFVDVTNNMRVHKCATTIIQYQDLKQAKNGSWPLVRTKDGKPCNFYIEEKIVPRNTSPETKTISLIKPIEKTVGKNYSFEEIINAIYQKAVMVGKFPTHTELNTENEDDNISFKRKKGLMNWNIIGQMDYYAVNHMLIKPWTRSGENKETWEEFLQRFKKTPWVDKSSILSKKKLDNWLKSKRKKLLGIEKTVEIFKDLPGLQKKIKKQLKKDIKKELKIRPGDIQEQAYFALFNNKKDLAAYKTNNDYDTDLDPIEEEEDTGSLSADDDSVSSSREEDDDDERTEYGDDLDDEELNENEEDYDIGIFD